MNMWQLLGMVGLGICVVVVGVCGYVTDAATTRNSENLNGAIDNTKKVVDSIDRILGITDTIISRLDALDASCKESGARLDELNTRFANLDAALTQLKTDTDENQARALEVEKLIGQRFTNIDNLFVKMHPKETSAIIKANKEAQAKAQAEAAAATAPPPAPVAPVPVPAPALAPATEGGAQ